MEQADTQQDGDLVPTVRGELMSSKKYVCVCVCVCVRACVRVPFVKCENTSFMLSEAPVDTNIVFADLRGHKHG